MYYKRKKKGITVLSLKTKKKTTKKCTRKEKKKKETV